MHDLVAAGAITPTTQAQSKLQSVMAQAGWHIDYVDVDLTRESPVAVVKCHRTDGRWVEAKVDGLGRCTIETFQRNSWLGRPKNAGKGRWPLSPQIDDLFLGRTKAGGPRAMLRVVTAYIADNALNPIALKEIRAAWAGVIGSPIKLIDKD